MNWKVVTVVVVEPVPTAVVTVVVAVEEVELAAGAVSPEEAAAVDK